ncbi:MAG: hypothetical protein EXQ52_17110 [Bryobacterales bacterium]|nr:hypothetical protein [Bryobacterales bacterium]
MGYRSSLIIAILAVLTMLGLGSGPADARNRKGEKLLTEGRAAEVKKDYDTALEKYEAALSEDPGDAAYQLSVNRVRFQAAQMHINLGQKKRAAGNLADALEEFVKAYAIDPASSMADQEIRRTRAMIEREKKKDPNAKSDGGPEAEAGMTPVQLAKRQSEDRFDSYGGIPELQPISNAKITLKMNNQPPKVLYETVGKLAGINVIMDPEYNQTGASKNYSVEFNGSTLEEALDYLNLMTKSFWKALSANTIFVTLDNTQKRRDHDEMIMKVFYLNNIGTAQELQEIVTALRTVTDIQKLFTYTAQSAIIVRAEADRVALAEKLIADLDKPKSEIVVDVLVLEVSRSRTRDLAAAIAQKGITSPITYTGGGATSSGTGTGTDPGTGTGTGTGSGASAGGAIPLGRVPHLSIKDYAITLPGGLIQAVLSDSNTRVLQSPQIRAADGFKSSLKIGDRVPIASGSFQPGIGGVGINPLVNTQFTFQDVGVNVDITPHVQGENEIAMHVELDISTVRDRIELGGISQPIIGQRKASVDMRVREGEINILGGLMQTQSSKNVSGIPGLAAIPVLRRLFTSEKYETSENSLLVVLVPHIVRRPEFTEMNLKGIAVGNATNVKLNYGPRKTPATPPASQAPATAPGANPPASPAPQPAPAVPAAPGAPVPVTPGPGEARATFVPSSSEGLQGGAVTVSLRVENAKDLFAGNVKLRFDPKILRVNDIAAGGLLSSDGQQVVPTKNIQNDTGEAALALNRLPGGQGISGSGNLATITFQLIGKGSSTVSVSQLTLHNSDTDTIRVSLPEMTITVK